MTPAQTRSEQAPLVIGATGGSGTRVVARIARQAGYHLGTNLNTAEDALEFVRFHDRWINRVLEAEREHKRLPAKNADQMETEFRRALARHQSTIPVDSSGVLLPWGWKAPRTIYLIPFLHAQFPSLKYIHVLRDGRDMAFSKNRNQLRKHGRRLLTWKERWFEPLPVRSLLLWSRVNLRAAEHGRALLGANFLTVRFEDLCLDPVKSTETILHFLHSPLDSAEVARSEISPPASIGRWRNHHPRLLARLQKAAAMALQHFEYPTT